MKTIAQIAEELDMSRQNVYLSVKQSGIDIDKLDKQKQGNRTFFSDDSVELIMSACLSKKRKNTKSDDVSNDKLTQIRTLEARIASLTKELTEAQDTLTKTLEELTKAHQEIARLQASEEEQRHTIASLSETIRLKTQQETLRLEAKQPGHMGLWQRIIKALGGDKV